MGIEIGKDVVVGSRKAQVVAVWADGFAYRDQAEFARYIGSVRPSMKVAVRYYLPGGFSQADFVPASRVRTA